MKKIGELYGVKFKGSAITGESKSYADLFDDTVAAKAKDLSMDQDKFEHELRKGNTNLLSYALATTPAALQAYRIWQAQNAPPSSGRSRQALRLLLVLVGYQ